MPRFAGPVFAPVARKAPSPQPTASPQRRADPRRGPLWHAIQLKAARSAAPASAVKAEGGSGLPAPLKAGIEQLSGLAMDDVRVHRNSSEPARLGALAYAKGSDIHLGPGQDRHLPHEAWHVVQQKQGRVRATRQYKGVALNDDAALEREADAMGTRATAGPGPDPAGAPAPRATPVASNAPVQRAITLADADAGIYERDDVTDGVEYYYTGRKPNDKPAFAPRIDIDKLEVEIRQGMKNFDEEAELSTSDEQLFAQFILFNGGGIKFYTDEKGLTDVTNGLKAVRTFAIRNALRHPIYSDPDKARGLAHRYAAANGVLFSRLPKDKAEEKLGKLPPEVTFYHVLATDWFRVVEENKAFWTETSEEFAYGRHANLRGVVARGPRSKLRQGTASTADADDAAFKDDTLTDKLPPKPGADTIDSDWVKFVNYANRKDRGAGQYKAMSNWNALGYAAYMFHHGQKTLNLGQDWEWLHIRGAQNGGATSADNLVAGTSTTNSRMIPWEDKINIWSNRATTEHPLLVRFQGWRVPGTHLGKEIKISIAAENGLAEFAAKVPKSKPMELTFLPLDGTVFDRVSERLTSKAIVEEVLSAEGGVMVDRQYVLTKGNYKGYNVQVRSVQGDKAQVLVVAAGVLISVDRSHLALKTTELGTKLPSKKELRKTD